MRLRPKRFEPSVKATDTEQRPITLTAGPGLQFELDIDEATKLATQLVDAIEQARRQVGSET